VKRIGITLGCPAGVGPEVVAAALAGAALPADTSLVLFGSLAALRQGALAAGVALDQAALRVVDVPLASSWAGQADDEAVRFQRESLLCAIEAAAAGELSALVTGPIRKRALQEVEGRSFPGQTELLHHFLARDDEGPLMCFTGGPFVLGLATVHLPLREVTAELSVGRVLTSLLRLHDVARRLCGEERPALVALGVNPHAGEGGLLGDEEQRVIVPALEEARRRGLRVEGPLPADGFFAHARRRAVQPAAVLAMHHDQGLAPYKILAEGRGVNLTWGLKVPRTSPDHGTADDIAGKGLADAASMQAALELACRLA
jgi:4-hydroxythreonine-4-phosphate dehydrogenase